MWDTDTMYKQVIAIYMHACRLTTDNYTLRELTIQSRKPHPLCEGCGSRDIYLQYRYTVKNEEFLELLELAIYSFVIVTNSCGEFK